MITGGFGKGSQCSQINLVDQDNLISDDKSLSKKFSNFFDTALKNFDIKGRQIFHFNEDSDPIDFVLNKLCRSSWYTEIKEQFNEPIGFNILEVIPNHIEKEIKKNFYGPKTGRFKNITLKEAPDICSSLL